MINTPIAIAATAAARLSSAQVALGQADAAFTTLEESRAQALQQLLLERQLAARVTVELCERIAASIHRCRA